MSEQVTTESSIVVASLGRGEILRCAQNDKSAIGMAPPGRGEILRFAQDDRSTGNAGAMEVGAGAMEPLNGTMEPPDGTLETPLADAQETRYVVHLPIFEGPLDLLLHLIEKRQMEITTISLMSVTDQYLAYLQQWEAEDLPLANMAAFVSIAARLLFIKSQSLLPHTTKEDHTGEAEDAAAMAEELQRHLLEYKLAKEIAYHLRQREGAGLQTHGRSGLLAGIEAQLAWTPPTLVGMEVQFLAQAFQRLLDLRAKDEANSADLLPLARVTVKERITEIIQLLATKASITLAEVIENERSRFVIIVTFLAVLEMWKREHLTVKQETPLGPIVLERGEHWREEIKHDEIEEE